MRVKSNVKKSERSCQRGDFQNETLATAIRFCAGKQAASVSRQSMVQARTVDHRPKHSIRVVRLLRRAWHRREWRRSRADQVPARALVDPSNPPTCTELVVYPTRWGSKSIVEEISGFIEMLADGNADRWLGHSVLTVGLCQAA